MQTKDDVKSKVSGKKPQPPTIFRKKQNAYVVAFALKDTYDDLVTAQQMICNRRSSHGSTNSITPTNSIKLLESSHTVKSEQVLDTPENKIAEENDKIEAKIDNATHIETNTSDSDDNKVIPFIETDGTTDSSNEDNPNYDKNETDIKKNAEINDEPEIIFNSNNYTQRSKASKEKFVKRKSKIHKIATPKCNKFICKAPKNNINKRLDKHYEKVKRKSSSLKNIQNALPDISIVVSRTRILKQGLAKENLLDESELTSISKNTLPQFNENDNSSQASYGSTAKNESLVSNSSGTTLKQISSRNLSKDEDMYSIGTVKSAIERPLHDSTTTYKSDVINVAVAVAYNKSKTVTKADVKYKNDKIMNLGSLTSQAQSLTMDLVNLTSELPSTYESLNKKDLVISTEKLKIAKDIPATKHSSFLVSSDETFDMARTSSDFNESTASTFTLKNEDDIEMESNSDAKETEMSKKANQRKQSILQTVINLGYYPEVTPSTSSAGGMSVDCKHNVVADANHDYHVCSKNMGDHRKESSVLKKQFDGQDTEDSLSKKTINLPNHNKIEEMLTEDNMKNIKYSEESEQPFNLTDMWDKLILVLDVAFKRLETTVTDKIIKELKNSITTLERYTQPIPENGIDLEKGDIIVIEPSVHEVASSSGKPFKESDGSVQCSLVKSEVIDEMMTKLSTQRPTTIIEPERSVKSMQQLKTKHFKNYFEVVKPPAVVTPEFPAEMKDAGDTVTISTVRAEDLGMLHRWRMLLFGPFGFVRENLFVISSVPAFVVILLFVYGLLMLLIKPW